MIDVEEVVRKAKESMAAYGDYKTWSTEDEMYALITAGAKIVMNKKQDSGIHLTEVIYEGIYFTHSSTSPLISTNPILH